MKQWVCDRCGVEVKEDDHCYVHPWDLCRPCWKEYERMRMASWREWASILKKWMKEGKK